jgi:HME family heavy-metal exporter
VIVAAASLPFFPRAFLPAFNEGTLTIGLMLSPGTSLQTANTVGTLAEKLLLEIPEVRQVGRRTGRAELDEHAEGVHSSELEVDLNPSQRTREQVLSDIRQRLSGLPVVMNVGQPISHRLDHLLSGVRAQIALKIFGEDLDILRKLSEEMQIKLKHVAGIVDLQAEKQMLIPQTQVRLDYQKAATFGVTPAAVNRALQTLVGGQVVSQVLEENRRFDVVIRLPDTDRTGLAKVLVETPTGYLPLSKIANIVDNVGPNQINRDNSRRRMVVFANTDGSDMQKIIQEIRTIIAATALPEGYFIQLEGQFQAQEEASRLISGLSIISVLLIWVVLYSRYHSMRICGIIMMNIPLALVGSVLALYWSGGTLSVASLVGFITLAGISTRNGILKISHYLHLMQHEGEIFGQKMIIRGSLERLTPVLMTALTAACALIPLLLSSEAAGKEILHPVAVVIFGGLMSATLLDTLLTPVMFYVWCQHVDLTECYQ